jgi:hypothetical protein
VVQDVPACDVCRDVDVVDDLGGRAAADKETRLVDVTQLAVGRVGDGDTGLTAVHGRLQERLRLLQLCFRQPPLGDVSGEARGPHDLAALIQDRVEEALVVGALDLAVDPHVRMGFAREGTVVVLLGHDAVLI